MRTVGADARRYAWCRGHALWIMGMPAQTFVEDLHGALAAGQDGLVRYAARMVGDACAVVLTLVLYDDRPIPPPSLRSARALERLGRHPLAAACWELIRGVDDEPSEAIVERCDRLVAEVRALAGEVPDILTPEGYFPALARAREWLALMASVDEEGFLPRDWTRAT